MKEKEFNLLNEPWVLLMRFDGGTDELSLKDVFLHAHQYKRLAGETPFQDVAMLRLLLAILHSVFGRYDAIGEYQPLNNEVDGVEPEQLLERWKSLWDMKRFPAEIIESYLDKYEERFYLFHPETPFYQIADIGSAKIRTVSKLNGELMESDNKPRLFASRTGIYKEKLGYSEAARWLLHLNGYDDAAMKTGTGVGWLGKINLIYVSGGNLFETLMQNLVFIKEDYSLWDPERPIWELDQNETHDDQMPIPNNLSELLTFVGRKVYLVRQDKMVIGHVITGGSCFSTENAFAEQMTLWKRVGGIKKAVPVFVPKAPNLERMLWRDFASLVAPNTDGKSQGSLSG